MTDPKQPAPSRRSFLQATGAATAAAALTAGATRQVHAADDDTIQLALIGCGGRGTGAAANALSVPNGKTKLVAMADVFEHRLASSHNNLKRYGDKVDVKEDAQFISFDGYKQAMDMLRPGDIAILATPPAFRWVQFKYAIERGLNVFMEKPISVDGPTSARMLELGKKAEAKNLKVGVGLMCRHCLARKELFNRIQDGEIGDLTLLRAYRMAGPTGSAATGPKPDDISELMYQIARFHAFLWASGGAFSDFLIHNIDEACWMKNDWPVEAKGSGGRHYRGKNVDQNFDSYSVEYTYADGAKLYLNGRTMPGCHQEFATYAHGTKGSAVVSTRGHIPAISRTFSGQNQIKTDQTWTYPEKEPNPYQLEWNDLIDAIRENKPYNEVERGAKASLVTAMGRMAAHTGQIITFDQMYKSDLELAPDVDKLVIDGPAPVQAIDGKYPIPMPGLITDTEY